MRRPQGDVELASLRQPNQREQEILQARATRALTGALSQEVGRVVQQTFGVDSFQITPLLMDPDQRARRGSSVNPAARVTIGKRISGSRLPHLRPSLSSVDARRAHPARIRSERQPRMGPLAERRSHLRAGGSETARLLMTELRGRGLARRLAGRARHPAVRVTGCRRRSANTSVAPCAMCASRSAGVPDDRPGGGAIG